MHKLVKWLFESLINLEKFFRVFCVFLIMLIALYWIQNLIGASWWWMGFISPILDTILDFVNYIYSFSFDFWGKEVEIKYFNAVLLIFIVILCLKAINIGIEKLYDLYDDAHRLYKKTNEAFCNKNLQNAVKNQEKQTNTYRLYIRTKVSNRYKNKLAEIDINMNNAEMNKFISGKFKVHPAKYSEGFLYTFNDFENVDNVLSILFTILEAQTPLDYMMCIQVGDDTLKLQQLIDLQEWGKIAIAADTLCRYEYNDTKKYKTTSVGIFQRNEGTLEVHEFVQKL